MSTSNNGDRIGAIKVVETARSIAVLRNKLIDLSNRNRLLNFSHGARSRGHVRIVDEVPEVLFASLGEGKEAVFLPLPQPAEDEDFEDENTDAFQSELEQARIEDAAFRDDCLAIEKQFGPDGDSEAFLRAEARAERALRDRVRKRLGLPSRRSSLPDPVAYARSKGIDPSYDLGMGGGSSKASHLDRRIQTLMFPDDLERRLSDVYEMAQQSLNEKGVNTLYVAFGFLEWFESDDSDKSLFAPLVLVPAEMKKRVEKGSISYSIHALDEEPQDNITLAARLKSDFKLTLPELGEDEGPDEYFKRVEEMISLRRRWRVRRFVTAGHFAFARLVMYNDLAERDWPEGNKPQEHALAQRLFGGSEASVSAGFRDVYNPDDHEYEQMAVPLVVDADSSQFSAVVDVAKGHNLVIQGPPGTGKSQTITNLIAASMGRGLSVLFVAEKMAALNVVMNRLQSVGLGAFCLELHSTKAKKSEVIDSLSRRLEMGAPSFNPARAKSAARELSEAKARLQSYLDLVKVELSDTELSIAKILWRAHRAPESVLPESLKAILVPDAERWSPVAVDAFQDYLNSLADAEKGMGTAPSLCAWRWFDGLKLTPLDFPDVLGTVDRLAKVFDELEREVAVASGALGSEVPNSSARLLDFLGLWGRIPLPDSPEEERAFEALAHVEVDSKRREWARRSGHLSELHNALRRWFPDGFVPNAASIGALERLAESNPNSPRLSRPSDCAFEKESLESRADDLDRVGKLIDRVARVIGFKPARKNAAAVESMWMFRRLVSDTSAVILADRSPARTSENARTEFDALLIELHNLRQEQQRLLGRLAFDLRSLSSAVLGEHQAALNRSGFFCWLSEDWREARRFVKALYPSGVLPARVQMNSDLTALRSFLDKQQRFFESPRFVGMFGALAQGFETDVDRVERIVSWSDNLRRRLDGVDHAGQFIRFVCECSQSDFSALDHLASREIGELLDRVREYPGQLLDNMEQAPVELRENAAKLGHLLIAVGELGLQPTQPLSQVPAITSVCREWMATAASQHVLEGELCAAFGGGAGWQSLMAKAESCRAGLEASNLPSTAKSRFLSIGGLGLIRQTQSSLIRCAETHESIRGLVQRLYLRGAISDLRWLDREFGSLRGMFLEAGLQPDVLQHWCTWLRISNAIERVGGGAFIEVIRQGLPAATVSLHFKHVIYRSMASRAHVLHPSLREFTGVALTEAQQRVRRIDAQLKQFAREEVLSKAWERGLSAPVGQSYGSVKTYTEMALVRQECGKKKRHVPLRDLLARAGTAIQRLKPCFMMSPMSVAQFLKKDGAKFDLVVFDEASQVLPEDALGALIRGNRLVVVGDQMQLPPTDFFQRGESESAEDMDEEESAAIQGLESILDKAAAVFQPARRLLWHYRSRDPKLIAFSNREFYDNALQIFPAAHQEHPLLGIKLVEVRGTYAGRCNQKEAKAVAEAAVQFMRSHPSRSLGIVALNSQQRDLIESKVDRLIADDPKASEYVQRFGESLEPFFVKNLENVQGDERDVIFISTVFGPDASTGKVYQRFGPINSPVGHRRLNVLFTRAKQSVAVFTSLKPEDVLAEAEGASRGRKALRQYLEYARSGRLEAGSLSGRPADSDFEDLVRERLRQAGYEVDCQVGVAGYFVDLGVRHPARKAHYILGVECDGATYHSFKSARDRDRLRQEILEGLGWKIHRIWSTDWFQNPDAEIRRLVERLEQEKKSSLSEETVHFDWKRFSAPGTDRTQKASGATQSEESLLVEDEPLAGSAGLKLPLADVETYLVGLRARAEDKVLAAFQKAVDFSGGSPQTIELDTLRSGTQRLMVLEELYNRAAFQWISDHRGSPLGGLPWVSNLTVGENLHLREFAVMALLKTGRI